MRKFAMFFVVASLLVALAVPAMAGPFSDVPANSWAYKAVQDLAAKGLVIGYGDGTFRGDRLATRYEMAMVVARMLDMYEKGQNAQDQKIQLNANDIATLMKLAEEFKSELASLNVRVAALEKKAALDTVNFTGDARFRLASEKLTYYALPAGTIVAPVVSSSINGWIGGQALAAQTTTPPDKKNDSFMRYRIRLNVAAPVADNISFNARLTMQKNAGVNGTNNYANPVTAANSGYMLDQNTLFVERSYITWTLNPYPVTFVLGRLPTMDTGRYYNALFLDASVEGGLVVFDMSNFLPSTSVSAAWVKLFDAGNVTSAQEASGLKDKDVYILNLKTKLFDTFGLEADYGYIDKFTYFGALSGVPGVTSGANGIYGKYDWWAVIGNWTMYNVNMWAGYSGTSTDMPREGATGPDLSGTHSVNGGAWRVGATIPLPVGALTGDFFFGDNKYYNPFLFNTWDAGKYKDYYNVYYQLPVAKNATLTLNYDYWKGKRPYNTDSVNGYYYTFNPDQIKDDTRYYIQMDVKF
ncbi:S-layer domain-containing protein [Thermodesulfobium narugense DSM 14796]|uniref:S-layer domain-containing protein n=1 Tax=Thermodesulfobium narugense DSM 14796 TaxID=747365 RepID=M1E4V2_9BACT|nr:DUF3373 family protein [Thermodesulfobium narugense]AEE13781.1 S-layer domain-containing protein [Thermodesulfobium narugense DSM 14796]